METSRLELREGTVAAGRTVAKKQLCNRSAAQTGYTQTVARTVVQKFLDEVIEELARGNRVALRDFGVVGTRLQRARKARNPRTSESVKVPAKAVVHFKVGKKMAEKAGGALRYPRHGHCATGGASDAVVSPE